MISSPLTNYNFLPQESRPGLISMTRPKKRENYSSGKSVGIVSIQREALKPIIQETTQRKDSNTVQFSDYQLTNSNKGNSQNNQFYDSYSKFDKQNNLESITQKLNLIFQRVRINQQQIALLKQNKGSQTYILQDFRMLLQQHKKEFNTKLQQKTTKSNYFSVQLKEIREQLNNKISKIHLDTEIQNALLKLKDTQQETKKQQLGLNQQVQKVFNGKMEKLKEIQTLLNKKLSTLTQVQHKYKQKITEVKASSFDIFPGIDKFTGQPIQISVETTIIAKQSKKIYEKIYYLDPEGYMLDDNMNYLLSNTNEKIKIKPKQVALLKQLGIFIK